MNPDGHGGAISALVRSGATEEMRRRGIDTISYFQVDNPLVTIADPVFLGFHLQEGAQMSSKVLQKACPEEKVGVMALADGRLTVIEYSDLDEETMHAREADGSLRYWAGSIAIHMLAVDFVEHMAREASMPWHVARKKIPYYEAGEVVRPDEPNGVKFEQFIFDALPETRASVTLEVEREEEFAPVKNASGVDSAESCRRLLGNRFARWIEAAGGSVARDVEGNAAVGIEISPLVALDAEDLRRALPDAEAPQVQEDFVLRPEA
jgi:UDP-N-acetylglucosamine/UDP-N-acetylgalactosamine diphosphorylase